MGNNISKEVVLDVAERARIHLHEDEAEKLAVDLQAVIRHSDLLSELDTTNVEPTTHVIPLENVMRKDEPEEWITQEDALSNAPEQKDGQFQVPSILSE